MPPDPLIGSLHSLRTPPIQNPGYAPKGAGCDLCIYIGQYNQRSKKLTNNILTCGYWEGTLALDGAGCDFCLYIGQYNQRSKKLTNNILTCGHWEGTLVLDGAGCDLCLYIGQYNQRRKKLTHNILTWVIGRGLSSLTGRGVISVSISDNIINEVRSLQTIYSPVVAGRVRNQRLSRTSFEAWWQPQPVPLRQERCLVSGESVRWGPRRSWSASTNTSTSSTFREPGDNQLYQGPLVGGGGSVYPTG